MARPASAHPTPGLSPRGVAPATLLALAAALAMGHSAQAAPPKPAGCLIEPERVADVGSPVTGIIEQLPVALGDEVREGQTLAVLRADVERAAAQAAALRASIDAEVHAAQASLQAARQKEQRTRALVQQAFVSEQALELATAEAAIAQQKLRLAQGQWRINGQDSAVARAQLGLRTLRSPMHGVVIERYSNLGERVEERPVLRIANIDTLRVSLMVPLSQYGQVKPGDTLQIRPELNGQAAVPATVTYVDKVVDAASNTFRVRLSLPNPGHRLPGGLRCKADWASATRGVAPPTLPSIAPSSVTPASAPPSHLPSAQAAAQATPMPPALFARIRHKVLPWAPSTVARLQAWSALASHGAPNALPWPSDRLALRHSTTLATLSTHTNKAMQRPARSPRLGSPPATHDQPIPRAPLTLTLALLGTP